MHELSLAQAAVDKALQLARDRGAKRICRVVLSVGELAMHGQEQFRFWLKEECSRHAQIARDINIELEVVPALIECSKCGYQGNLNPENYDQAGHHGWCPACGEPDIKIKQGQECRLAQIELEA